MDAKPAAAPLSPKLNLQLSVMMFLQYAIWGAWLPLFYSFLTEHRKLGGDEVGYLFSLAAVGALAAPFISGQIADRFFNTEKFLAISHIVGAIMVWQLAAIENYWGLVAFGILYSMIYAPTLALTNSLAFHHLPDRDRDFGKVRVWGTIGWIAVGIGLGQWLLHSHTPSREKSVPEAKARIEEMRKDAQDGPREMEEARKAFKDLKPEEALRKNLAAKLAAAEKLDEAAARKKAGEQAGKLLALEGAQKEAAEKYKDKSPDDGLLEIVVGRVNRPHHVAGMADSFKLSAILGVLLGIYCLLLPKTPPQPGKEKFAPWEALVEVKKMPLLALFLISFPVACIHQFYFVHTAGFLGTLNDPLADKINMVFGVGGGGLMTIGQIFEIVVLAFMPVVAKKVSRKGLLCIGLVAYSLRFLVFGFVTSPALIVPTLALHGLCFGCFFFIAFMIVDEETPGNVRASAQGLFNFVVIGLGTIVGNAFAGWVGTFAGDGPGRFRTLFGVPLAVAVVCLVATLAIYPSKRRAEPAA